MPRISKRVRVCDQCGRGPREGVEVSLVVVPVVVPVSAAFAVPVRGNRWLCTLCEARRARRGGSRV